MASDDTSSFRSKPSVPVATPGGRLPPWQAEPQPDANPTTAAEVMFRSARVPRRILTVEAAKSMVPLEEQP